MKIRKVFLIGENPFDTEAVSNLLGPVYQQARFISSRRGPKGDGIMNAKLLRILHGLWIEKEFEFLIFIKDMDGFEDDSSRKRTIEEKFSEIQKVYPAQNILLINIQELESLILADPSAVNIKFTGNPMMVVSPKDHIKREQRKAGIKRTYEESDAPEIFKKLDFNKVKANCRFFRDFVLKLEQNLL